MKFGGLSDEFPCLPKASIYIQLKPNIRCSLLEIATNKRDIPKRHRAFKIFLNLKPAGQLELLTILRSTTHQLITSHDTLRHNHALVPQTRSMQRLTGAVAKTQIRHQYHFKETATTLKRSLAIFLQSPILALEVLYKYTKKKVILGGLEIVYTSTVS